MDNNQKLTLLRAIAISTASSPTLVPLITPQSRSEAYTTLEQFKQYDRRVDIILELIQMEQIILPINNDSVDITASTKLYMLSVLQLFLKTQYAKLNNENDRLAIRHALLLSARELLKRNIENAASTSPVDDNEARFLAVKIAALIADIATRDFPQRWTTFITDLFLPPDQGGLWYIPPDINNNDNTCKGYGPMIGIKICLECLKIITEDCTDGDFNAKISTSRRNDVLTGLNEVNRQFIPLIFDLLSSQYVIVSSAKQNIMEMCKYLSSSGRTLASMTMQEKPMYDGEIQKRDKAARIVTDCLATIEKFCQSMPTSWMLGLSDSTITQNQPNCDFLAALLHLLREQTSQIQVLAVRCLFQLLQRKLEFKEWLRLISMLPQAISDANEVANTEDSVHAAAEGIVLDHVESLVKKYPFHLELSKMLSQAASGYIAHITDKSIIKERGGQNYQIVASFLNLLADMLSHPSGRVCGVQSNTWANLLRDPQLTTKSTQLLQPCLERVLVGFMTHLVKIRWSDVEEQEHPMSLLLEETWDDKNDYDLWIGDFRSKANLLMRLIGAVEPRLAATAVYQKFKSVFTMYGSGEIRDALNNTTGQLTQESSAVMALEGLMQPMDNLLQGMPDWALDTTRQNDPSFTDPNRVEIRNKIHSMFNEIATSLISWNPNDCWMKFRRVTLLESLKHFWKHDPSTLASGLDVFLVYLGETDPVGSKSLRDDYISLRKKSGVALVSVSKRIPHLLVPWIDQLSARVGSLISSDGLVASTKMHLFEFLSCVATAVEDPVTRSNFIADVLSNALSTLESPQTREAIGSVNGLLTLLGVQQVGSNPSLATNEAFVQQIVSNYIQFFSSINQLLSVGKRCHEAARQRPNAGIPLPENQLAAELSENQQNFPDEGAVSISDLSMNDPFVHLWPRILPPIIQILEVLFTIWTPEYQGVMLKNPIQRFLYAISDDEAYMAKNQSSLSGGGVFGEGGTAGSVVSGWDRRDCNLAPKWSGWFNEIRHTCIQLLGLICGQRALFSPEIASFYPRFVSVIANQNYLKAMEHRHLSQYIKQFIEYFHLCCPSTLYQSHVLPIATHFFEHMEYRLKYTWLPILGVGGASSENTKPFMTTQCDAVADIAQRAGEEWYTTYYYRSCAFVGDLDAVHGEAVVEKFRVDLSRCYADMLQTSLALKGDWNLVLANIAREEHATKANDTTLLENGPKSKMNTSNGPVNANGTTRSKYYKAIEARKLLRINKLCHFLLLENEKIAGYLVLSIAECLGYPDAYTCRRCIAISHRILETVAWVEHYTKLLGEQMFTIAVRTIVKEPKWLVGTEWDMINLIRDLYCRLVLGQYLQPGGQGLGNQQPIVSSTSFEQTKYFDKPLQGGGILCTTSDLPRQVLASYPGVTPAVILDMESKLKDKRSAKEQKEFFRDLLHTAAENVKASETNEEQSGVLGRANDSESLLNSRSKKDVVPSLPEKLVTHSMMMKQHHQADDPDEAAGYGAQLFG